jgi:hypothetical protein
VFTTIPSLTGVRQATTTRGGCAGAVVTSTWQMRHEPTGDRPGW